MPFISTPSDCLTSTVKLMISVTQSYIFISSRLCVVVARVFPVEGSSYVDVGVTLTGRTSVSFQVRAASDAHVGLTPERGVYTENNMYEIVLGSTGNTWTVIRSVS